MLLSIAKPVENWDKVLKYCIKNNETYIPDNSLTSLILCAEGVQILRNCNTKSKSKKYRIQYDIEGNVI